MKNLATITIIAVAFTTLLVNKAKAQKGFNIGIQTGIQATDKFNKNNMNHDGFRHKVSIAPTLGVSAGYNFSNHMGISTQTILSAEWQKYMLHGVELNAKHTYLKVPVFFNYNTNPNAKVMFTAKLGPQVGFLFNATLKDSDRNTLISNTKDDYSSVTFGAAGGAGISVSIAKNLYFDAGMKLDAHYGKNKEEVYADKKTNNTYSNAKLAYKPSGTNAGAAVSENHTKVDNSLPVLKNDYKTVNTNVGVEIGIKYFF